MLCPKSSISLKPPTFLLSKAWVLEGVEFGSNIFSNLREKSSFM